MGKQPPWYDYDDQDQMQRRWKRRHHWRPWHGPYGIPHHRGRFLFLRFAATFGVIALLVLGGMAALAFLLTRLTGGTGQVAMLVWLIGSGLTLTLPMLGIALAIRAFRGIAMPLADIMAAADSLASGDLGARVPVRGPGEFAQLAASFNRMAEELQRADRQRRDLTADVAHELRTPLHILQGNLEGILDGVYQPTPEHISATLEETRALARLVEDLRTLSLAEAGQLPLTREPLDVAELLSDVSTSFGGQAEAAGISLRQETVETDAPMMIIGDPGRLDQVLSNLLANALRHTPAGGTIMLRAEAMPGAPGEGAWVRLTVRDTGEGISPEDLPYIFERFWRGDRSRSHAGGAGSGLGLAIARQLVQAHGGRIAVESQPGQGTTFTIDLPAG